MELDPGQLTLVGVICTLLIYLIRLGMQYAGWKPSLPVIGVITLVVSLAVSVLMVWKNLPPLDLSDPMALVQTLVVQLTAVTGMATLIYNLMLKTILEKLGLDPTTMAQRLKGGAQRPLLR